MLIVPQLSCRKALDKGQRQTYLKLPSTPDTSMALIIILVNLKGTCITHTC